MTQSPKPVVITRTYRATLQEGWELWATKEGFEAWWGPVGFKAVVHQLEAREGGTLHYEQMTRMAAEGLGSQMTKLDARFA